MKKILKIAIIALVLGSINPVSAQVNNRNSGTAQTADIKPLKGTFRISDSESYTIAEIDLYDKTIDGYPSLEWDEASCSCVNVEGDEPVKVYGMIEERIPGITTSYYIIYVDSAESPEPNIWIHNSMWGSDTKPVRVSVDYDASKQTITLNDWEGGTYFSDVTLKRVK